MSEVADDKETALSAIVDKPKIKMIYEYDFGDGENIVAWMGDAYDRKEFDIDDVNQNLRDYKDIDMGLN